MTTEPRPGVPGTAELRERLVDIEQMQHVAGWTWADTVDAILAEITAAGLSIVATDRLERMRLWAEYAHRGDTRSWFRRDQRPTVSLEPGDLDPLAGGDR